MTATAIYSRHLLKTSEGRSVEFTVVPVPEVPKEYWEKYHSAHAVLKQDTLGAWVFYDDVPSMLYGTVKTGDGTASEHHLAVIIPSEYAEPQNNEWGEVFP